MLSCAKELRKCHYEVKRRKALRLQVREALWCNCKRTQSSKSRFFLCERHKLLLRSLRSNKMAPHDTGGRGVQSVAFPCGAKWKSLGTRLTWCQLTVLYSILRKSSLYVDLHDGYRRTTTSQVRESWCVYIILSYIVLRYPSCIRVSFM